MSKHVQLLITGLVAVLVVLSLVWAYRFLGTPAEQRALRMDLQRVHRLDELTNSIARYYRSQDKPKLPESLEQVRADPSANSFYLGNIYEDPLTGKLFEYRRLSDNEYELCAEFQTDFREEEKKGRITSDLAAKWMHPKGRACFRFRVSPEGDTSRIEPTRTPGD